MARYSYGDVVNALVQKGLPLHVAQGVAMNFKDESGLDTGIQEHSPIAGRGGYGLAQWTGPRRTALENYAASSGRAIDDLGTQLDYFMQENAGPEAQAWSRVMAAPNAQQAAVNFLKYWERPAAQHQSARAFRYAGTDPQALMSAHSDERERDTSLTAPQGSPPAPFVPSEGTSSSPEEKDAGFRLGDAVVDAGQAMAGGKGGGVPSVPLPKPMATLTEAQPGMTLSPQAVEMSRARLAQAMARLNAGKLFVG